MPLFEWNCHWNRCLCTLSWNDDFSSRNASVLQIKIVLIKIESSSCRNTSDHSSTKSAPRSRQLLRYPQQLVQGELHHLAVDDVVVCLSQIASKINEGVKSASNLQVLLWFGWYLDVRNSDFPRCSCGVIILVGILKFKLWILKKAVLSTFKWCFLLL